MTDRTKRWQGEYMLNEGEPRVEDMSPEDRGAAVRHVASAATDAADCAELLAALGLDAKEGRVGRMTWRWR